MLSNYPMHFGERYAKFHMDDTTGKEPSSLIPIRFQ